MLIIVLINIAIIICIYLRYYDFSENIRNAKEKVEQIDPILMGFIKDRGINNNYDLILSEIVNLHIKKYIIIEYDKNDVSKYNYTIKQNYVMENDNIEKYDLVILNFLFSQKPEISRNELQQKIIDAFGSYNIQYNQLKEVLQEKLVEQSIIDMEKQKELTKYSKIYKRISIIITVLILILNIFSKIEISSTFFMIYIFEILAIRILLLKASNYTNKGEAIRNRIIKYKYEIENKEFLVNKKEMNDVLLEKEFADTIALHINTDAKLAFIDNDILKKVTNSTVKILIKLFIIIILAILTYIILQKITLVISKDAIILLYSFIAIIIAGSADVAYALAINKKQK